ncbi:MAG: SDR family oxidoreductase [Candidatus Dadabacteria bacterium]|nr:MAG: SDR family oxidoreductase [Candidatus Dadabacteria bacterium]
MQDWNDWFTDGFALVAGGSGGIGAACAQALAEAGSDVALGYRGNRDRAEEVATDLAATGVRVELVHLDLSDAAAVRAAIDRLTEIQPLHSVINAAGAAIDMTWISELTPQHFAEVLQADAGGAFNLFHAALPALRQTHGSIVQISSAGLRRYPTRDILSVAPKAAIEALIRGIAREEGRHGVRANSIGVGVVDAGMFTRLRESHLDEEWQQAAIRNTPLRRFGDGAEVGRVACFLASRAASFVTGQFIAVDGGYSV